MSTIVVSGVSGAIGRQLVDALEREDADDVVLGLDRLPPRQRPPRLDFRPVDLSEDGIEAQLDDALSGADVLVHLAFVVDPTLNPEHTARANVDGTRHLLEAAGRSQVGHVVHVSTASAYGAWPGNAVPLDEDSPLRPNPEFAPAVHKAEAERLVAEWRREHPGVTVTTLRPVFVLGPSARPALSALAHRRLRPLSGQGLPVRQFVHEEDAASAVLLAVRQRLDGVFNVAPDGWEEPLPPPARLARRWRGRAVPDELVAYGRHPWVVSNAKLRATGWSPRRTTTEAVAACSPLPDRRPLVVGAAALGAGIAAGLVAGRVRRR